MSEYITAQLDTIRSLDYEYCPGEAECGDPESKKSGPIAIYREGDPDVTIAEICEACPFLPTKPGQEPEHLRQGIIVASELDAIKNGGGAFQYPDALSPFEWCCLKAHGRGVAKSKANEEEERRNKTPDLNEEGPYRQSEIARLNEMRHR